MMNKDNLIIIGLIVALSVGIFGLFHGGRDGRDGRDGLGAIPGPEIYDTLILRSNFINGGIVTSTTTVDATITLDASHLRREVSLMSMNIGVDATITTMASTSAPLVDLLPGQSFQVYFFNASTTAGSLATFAAGTGVALQEDEEETVVVNGLDLARLTFIKKPDSDVALIIEVFQVGD